MNIKDMRGETMTLPMADYARLLVLSADREKVREKLKYTEAKIVRMREQLTNYQRICERMKSAEVAE